MTPWGVTVDLAGNVIIGDIEDDRVFAVPPKSGTFYGQSMKADHIYTIIGDGTSEDPGIAPVNLAVDSVGNILIIAQRFPTTIVIAVVKSGTYYGQQMQAGNAYAIAGGGAGGGGADGLGDGGLGVSATLSFTTHGIAVGPHGEVYIDDLGDNRIRQVIR